MIGHRYFLQGHLDKDEKTLITSDEVYDAYLLSEKNKIEAEKVQEKMENESDTDRFFREGAEYAAQIKRCGEQVKNDAMAEKLRDMEYIVTRIFDKVKAERNMHVIFDEEVELTGEGQHIITLSTCINNQPDKRYLVQGVLINEE